MPNYNDLLNRSTTETVQYENAQLENRGSFLQLHNYQLPVRHRNPKNGKETFYTQVEEVKMQKLESAT